MRTPRQRAEQAATLVMIEAHAELFRHDFPEWIETNWHLWVRFEAMALEVAAIRPHYSVAVLWEVLRHHTLMSEVNSDFKLNNNFKADVARLFVLVHPQHESFFAFRQRTTVSVAEATFE